VVATILNSGSPWRLWIPEGIFETARSEVSSWKDGLSINDTQTSHILFLRALVAAMTVKTNVRRETKMASETKKQPWITEQSYVSPWSYRAAKELHLPEKVTVYDITLRDGEQYPGLVFRKEEKIELAQELEAMGIERFEAGMAAVSQDDFDAMKEICKRVSAKVVGFCRGLRADVDLSFEAGVWGVIVEVPTSQSLVEKAFHWTQDDVIKKAVDVCNYAKSKGLHITFFMVDSAGADPGYLENIVRKVVSDTNLDSLVVVDTFGRLNPIGAMAFVKKVKGWVGELPIEVHFHNDFGLATANTLAGVTAGASVVQSAMLGLGERSGATPTEEIAVALKFLYGIETGINYERIVETARKFQSVAGLQLPGHKPVVGEGSFSYEVGVAAMMAYNSFEAGFPLAVMPYLAQAVGSEFRILLGKKSGKFSVKWYLKEMGKTATEEQVEELVKKIKDASLRRGGMVTEDEFRQFLQETVPA